MNWVKTLRIIKHKIFPDKYGFKGDYANWDKALNATSGYDSDVILNKTADAYIQIKEGKGKYERDSYVFEEVQYSWPLVSALLWIANKKNGELNLIDFGGSIGSTYYQNKFFLSDLKSIKWHIIEQENFVKYGIANIQDETIRFHYSIEDILAYNGKPDVLLISCTLPYLSEPYKVLDNLLKYNFEYLVFDNTFFNYENRDRICVQIVSPDIYNASYPCWFLNYNKVLTFIKKNYSIIAEYKNESFLFLDGRKIQYKGFIAKLNEKQS
jgi:putative methyltransferase (TIGR04325 family)